VSTVACLPGDLVRSRLDPRYWLCTNCGVTVVDAHGEREAQVYDCEFDFAEPRDDDDLSFDDDRAYSTEDDDRIPPPEEGEV
jgi:hypothetical protein